MIAVVCTIGGLLVLLGAAHWSAPSVSGDELAAFDRGLDALDSIAPRRVRRRP